MGLNVSKLIYPGQDLKNNYTQTIPKIAGLHGTNYSAEVQYAIYQPEGSKPTGVIIWSHGNGSCNSYLESRHQKVANLTNKIVVGYEYIGYDGSKINKYQSTVWSSSPSEDNCYLSIKAIYQEISNPVGEFQRNHGNLPIYLVGQSIGTGPSCWLGAQGYTKIEGVILISPYVDLGSVVSWYSSCLVKYFPNYLRVPEMIRKGVEVTVIHGKYDEIIDCYHSEYLKKNNPDLDLILLDKRHNDIFSNPTPIFKHLERKLKDFDSLD